MSSPPSLFLSHGAPNLLLHDSDTRDFWRALSAQWPKPSAILIMSAHFTTAQPVFERGAHPGMIYDFSGFAPELYRMTYPAPGAPALAEKAAGLAQAARLAPVLSDGRGYDHGAWVPLKVIYPEADIPVATLSVQPDLDGAHHFALGRAVAPLRDEGVLIIGSGSATHNLRAFFGGEDTQPWALPFNEWLFDRIESGDSDAIAHWERGPDAQRNHPTPEHYLPLPFAFGAGGPGARGKRLHHALVGPISLDAYAFE